MQPDRQIRLLRPVLGLHHPLVNDRLDDYATERDCGDIGQCRSHVRCKFETETKNAMQYTPMGRSFWTLSTVVVFLGSVCGNGAPARGEDPASIDLEEIARRLTQWRDSFVNVRVVWDLRRLPTTDEAVVEWPAPPAAETGSLISRDEWIWADDGLDLIENRSFSYAEGRSEARSIEAFNGRKGVMFRASFRRPPTGAEEFTVLELKALGSGKPTSQKPRTPMVGVYWSDNAAWLPEMLSQGIWKLEGIEHVGGEPCARLAAARREAPHFPIATTFATTLWLDLNHACLVRRLRRFDAPPQTSGIDFIVDEFQRIQAGIWFPKHGRIQLGGRPHQNHTFVVTEVAVNQSLDPARFDPPTPDVGTLVDDHGKVYRHGVTNAQAAQGAKSNGAGKTKSGDSSPTPPTSGWLWASAAVASVLVVALAAGFWYSRQKRDDR